MDKFAKDLVRHLRKARSFPTNTCPYSRHAQMIGENLIRSKPYPMLQEDPEHCGGSILATVLALYQARDEIEALKSKLSPQELRPSPSAPDASAHAQRPRE